MKRGLGTSRLRRGTRIEKTAGTPGIGGLGRWQRTIAQPHLGVRTAIAAASTKMANPRVSTSLAAGSERLAVVTRGPCRTDHLGRPARQWLRLAMAPPELMQHMAEQEEAGVLRRLLAEQQVVVGPELALVAGAGGGVGGRDRLGPEERHGVVDEADLALVDQAPDGRSDGRLEGGAVRALEVAKLLDGDRCRRLAEDLPVGGAKGVGRDRQLTCAGVAERLDADADHPAGGDGAPLPPRRRLGAGAGRLRPRPRCGRRPAVAHRSPMPVFWSGSRARARRLWGAPAKVGADSSPPSRSSSPR